MIPPSRERLRRYVLVADADLQRALFYRQLFAEQGADAVITRDGQDALHILDRRGPPALLLTDLSLLRLDGLAVIAELRRRASPAETPVLAFSAFEDLRAYASARQRELGIADICSHTVPIASLRQVVRRLLAGTAPGAVDVTPAMQPPNEPSIEQALRAAATECLGAFAARGVIIYVKSGDREWVHSDVAATDAATELLHEEGWLVRGLLSGGDPFILPEGAPVDLVADAGFKVQRPRGFAGVPLATRGGGLIGVLGLFDAEQLQLGPYELDALQAMGHRLMTSLEQHLPPPAPPVQKRGESVLVDEEFFRNLSHLALSDSLTGLANRRGGELAIQREIARARREGTPLSFVLIDVDDFKRWNDEYGHDAGDDILRRVASLVGGAMRGSDLAVRWGGEEFLLVLPNVSEDGAAVVAERLRAQAEESTFDERPLTISAGVAELRPSEDVAAVLARADAKLSQAKTGGRNRVVV